MSAQALHTLQTRVHLARKAVTVGRGTSAEKLMRPNDLPGLTGTEAARLPGQRPGARVRAARLAAGLTLAELGQLCGYSASQISRYERGVQPLTDITLLHRFAAALAIPPQIFGLAPPDSTPAERHAEAGVKEQAARTLRPNVSREFQPEGGEDPVLRRELLARAAGFAGVTALGLPSAGLSHPPSASAGPLEDVLYGTAGVEPAPLKVLRGAAIEARGLFQTAHYGRLTAVLPQLIGTAIATRDNADGDDRATASALLADAYIVAANLVIKVNDDPFAWTLADRALQAAQGAMTLLPSLMVAASWPPYCAARAVPQERASCYCPRCAISSPSALPAPLNFPCTEPSSKLPPTPLRLTAIDPPPAN